MLLVNLHQDYHKKNHYFSNTLLSHIDQNIEKGKKTIIYLNKRGDSSALICESCQYIFTCNNCDVSLNIHNYPTKMICHLCNESQNIASSCPQCNKTELKKIGIGTQQVELFLKEYYKEKNIKIFRFDADVIKNKTEKAGALEKLHNSDIIIGTKMITTGFDFSNVGLVGVLLLEQELLIAGYNTQEKVYSNIKQLIGRGGRKGEITETIIQTFIPDNKIIKNITEKNYKDFFIETLKERKLFRYPPFNEMVTLEFRHKSEEKAREYIQKLENKLQSFNDKKEYEILMTPNGFKKYNQYFFKIIIKGNNIRDFIGNIKGEILKTSHLSVKFEY